MYRDEKLSKKEKKEKIDEFNSTHWFLSEEQIRQAYVKHMTAKLSKKLDKNQVSHVGCDEE